MYPLAAAEHFWFEVHAQSILQAAHLKRRLHTVAEVPVRFLRV
jgi:hypothetical protein